MSNTARERASSRGAYAWPKRVRPAREPRAEVKAVPRARNVSSVVWWSSTVDLVSKVGTIGGTWETCWLDLLYTARVNSSLHVSPMHVACGLGSLHLSISKYAANWSSGRHGALRFVEELACLGLGARQRNDQNRGGGQEVLRLERGRPGFWFHLLCDL